jgi:Methyltransferase domain/Glycosyl transferase family 2/Glycosyltransferase like family
MAIVSILISARKGEYLGRALMSAQRQTFDDLEIIVGDGTPDGSLRPIVDRRRDARVRYVHHGFGDAQRNARSLWAQARGRYVKWLDEEDMLMPTSVEVLLEALRQHPESALAFHGRVFIDGGDAVVHTPPSLLKVGERALIDREMLVTEMIGQLNNFVGEFSNVLIDRQRASEADLFAYRSFALDFLYDVATYLNLAERGPLVVVGGCWSMRRLAGQGAPQDSPNFSAGLYEWELFMRGEASAGRLSNGILSEGAKRLGHQYAQHAGALPEIRPLLAHLDELTKLAPEQIFVSDRFQADLAQARAAVAARVADHEAGTESAAFARSREASATSGASRTQQHICAVCEQAVDNWLPDARSAERLWFDHLGEDQPMRGRLLCPKCGCDDHDRHLWLYIAFSGLLERASEMRILHIAPEARIEPRIAQLAPKEYVVADLIPRAPGRIEIDVESLDFSDGHFDLIICNRVLQRVDHPDKALAELHRCLKRGGHLIAQTPYLPALKYTFELTKAPSAKLATRYFGQPDHLRVFGTDIDRHFHEAGFEGEIRSHAAMLGDVDAHTWGCDEGAPFFLFAKGWSTPSSGSSDRRAAAQAPAVCSSSSGAASSKPIRIICATRVARDRFLEETALGRSLAVQRQEPPPELVVFDNNTTGLATLYNAAIEQAATQPAILVFIHDDVSIADFFWTERIHEALQHFDVVGLAGNKRRLPRQPAWAFGTPDFKWDDLANLSGSVGHGKGFPCDLVSRFGPAGIECKLLDGLMLVADSERLIESGLRFDEQFDFHFYDMDFCRQAEMKQLRMGTWPIAVVHESGGAFGTAAWRAGYERYLRKYGE